MSKLLRWTSLFILFTSASSYAEGLPMKDGRYSGGRVTVTSKGNKMPSDIKTIKLGGVNCYLLKTDNRYLLIDTGLSNKRTILAKELEGAGCRPGNLKLIILTHGDSDHAGNGVYLREKYGAPIAMHRSESDAVKSGDPTLNKKIKRNFKGIIVRIILSFFKLKTADRFGPDLFIDEGYALSEHGFDAQVLHISGHSNGSLGILTTTGDLFCGDLLLNNLGKPGPGFGIVDTAEFKASIEKLKKLNVKTVYPGHGQPFPMELFLRSN